MAIPKAKDFEKLGAFYLGREYDIDAGEKTEDLILYDSKDLTTHAVCVGMTGSGKTGLCVSLLEEAAIDGIPALIIDPKGDMGNLLLNFPKLRPEDFKAWVDPDEASRKGKTPEEHAEWLSQLWRNGLADWGENGARVKRVADSAELAIYTPGSNAGRSLTVLRSFDAPSQQLVDDKEAFAERIQAATSGLLSLLGVDADPIRSREAILVSNILQSAWSQGKNLELVDLIREIQNPPFEKLGVIDLESFYPQKERLGLAMRLNGVLASPSFAPWLEGEPLEIKKLLYTPEGKPRLAVLSISHLSDPERMFFVTILLNEIVSWMRTQSGTGSLRAILYMDEIFGYFPPTAEPPSKKPMLTLLKQARAYGVGVVLATQNPVDLDYKGLSNTGTWFIGRLQTERDKERVLDGLEGAMTGSGKSFKRREIDATLSSLGKRVFLMNNVHEDEPVVFHTRWALSYLRGPLTREQIKVLMAGRKRSLPAEPEKKVRVGAEEVSKAKRSERPLVPKAVKQHFLARRGDLSQGDKLLYRAAIYATISLHYKNARAKVDEWRELQIVAPMTDDDPAIEWEEAETFDAERDFDLRKKPEADTGYGALPAAALRPKSYVTWSKELKRHVYQHRQMEFFKSPDFRMVSEPEETEGEFRVRVTQAAKEKRDIDLEKLRAKYAPKLERIQDRIRKAKDRVDIEEAQYKQSRRGSWMSIGTTVLGGLFGRKTRSYTSARRASSSASAFGRASKEKDDIERAEREVKVQKRKFKDLEADFEEAIEEMKDAFAPEELEFDSIIVRPLKTDIAIKKTTLLWVPWRVDSDGIAERAF